MKKERIKSLDFLRGIAIIAVVIHHSGHYLKEVTPNEQFIISTGRYGVNLFFIISGLVIANLWFTKKQKLSRFYLERIYRILPLFIFGSIIYNFGDYDLNVFLNTIIFTSHFFNFEIGTSVPGGWSIVSEIYFYFLFPIFIFFCSRIKNYQILIIANVSFIFFNFLLKPFISDYLFELGKTDLFIRNYLFYNFLNQIPLFLIGIFLYFVLIENKSMKSYLYIQFPFLIFLHLIQNGYLYNFSYFDQSEINKNFYILCSILGLIVFLSVKVNISFTLINYLGRYSYGIYIFHYLAMNIIDYFSIKNYLNNVNKYLLYIICLSLILLISTLLAKLFEDTLLKNKHRVFK